MLEPVDNLLYAVFGEPGELPTEFLPRWCRHNGKIQLATLLEECLQHFSVRDQRILDLRFGLRSGSAMTYEQLGPEFCVTRERIRQIEGHALRHLRHPAYSRRLKLFEPSNFAYRIACARRDLYLKLKDLYPPKVALTVALRVKLEDLREAFKSTEAALKSSCGRHISTCIYCGKPLPPGWNFCDIHCQAKWRVVTLVCDGCGKLFDRHVSQMFKHKDGQKVGKRFNFCSISCYRANAKRLGVFKRLYKTY